MSWRYYRKNLIIENKWRAARYGINGALIDFGKEEEVPLRFLISELLELVDDVVDELGSRQAVEYARTILDEGTSADRQLACYRARLEAGDDEQTALNAVVDQLVAETQEGLQA
jgi:carboxylate-amine ligase